MTDHRHSCSPLCRDTGLVIWRECSSREDTMCRCIPGYFCETQEGDHCSTCSPHTNCSLGQRVVERGNYFQDTVCADCPTGTFSPGGAQEECLPWTKTGSQGTGALAEAGKRQHCQASCR